VVDYRTLLVKYIANVAASEGKEFAARDAQKIAPCGMGAYAFTPEEIRELNDVIFPEIPE
jgi:hypothetical protein